MKKLKAILFSMATSVILLAVFAVSIAYATFIENSKGTEVAQKLIYNAKWFEFLLLLLAFNLIGNVIRYKLVSRRKWSILLFHLAFIVMLLGAAITRYSGSEGVMHIREGKQGNEFSSEETAIRIEAEYRGAKFDKVWPVQFSPNGSNLFSEKISIGGKEIDIENEAYVPDCVETIVPDKNGEPSISLFTMDEEKNVNEFILSPGEINTNGNCSFGFDDRTEPSTISFVVENGELKFKSLEHVLITSMMDSDSLIVEPGTSYPCYPKTIYRTQSSIFVMKVFMPNAKRMLNVASNNSGKTVRNAFVVKAACGNEVERANVFESGNDIITPTKLLISDVALKVSYGKIPQKLPFSIALRKFEIERYPGSNSPSSYASEITIVDSEKNVEKPFRIFMNNILKYRGYRIFQSSYDSDEKGTILLVSHDYWGTMITYIGYFLMFLGMILTLFNPSSRFRTVIRLSSELQEKRRGMNKLTTIVVLIFIGLNGLAISASAAGNTKEEHFKNASQILVQDYQGRIEPLSTLSSELLRKVYKKSEYNGKSAVEVFVEMNSNPDLWKNEPIIKVGNAELRKQLKISGNFISFNQFFDFENEGAYRIQELVESTYQKSQQTRNKFDKEVINIDERVNICYQIFNGDYMKIFPEPGEKNKVWTSGIVSLHLAASMGTESTSALLTNYYEELNQSLSSSNWSKPNEILFKIKDYQVRNGSALIPNAGKIKLEVTYNQLNIFGRLAKFYAFFGFILLIFNLINIFKSNNGIAKTIKIGTYVVGFLFFVYTVGLGIRWYISGHAPWSNGYETMIFVGWATSLAGLIFVRKSPITLSVTTVLSGIVLFVASMSWMNPEITNLVPVLKSYWLIVHVAVITSSYGFLAMGALLGMLNLLLMIFRTKYNVEKISSSTLEISYIIEQALIIGLILLTIGSFIGGIWANESWGRYWGWDPKETWALVSILVYAVILHLRNVPGLNNQFTLSSLALIGFSSVLMTFFGVNYYLSGMHSYAQGEPVPVPKMVYVAIIFVILIIVLAYFSERKLKRENGYTEISK
jgi:cytochrome c-type biogenesis protein CcsB